MLQHLDSEQPPIRRGHAVVDCLKLDCLSGVPDYEGILDFRFTKEIYTMSEIIRYTPANIADAVHPQTALHEAAESAVKTYNDSIEAAKQARDEAVKSAQKQYELSLKAYNAAVEAASKR